MCRPDRPPPAAHRNIASEAHALTFDRGDGHASQHETWRHVPCIRPFSRRHRGPVLRNEGTPKLSATNRLDARHPAAEEVEKQNMQRFRFMAERVGFEPTVPVKVLRISSAVQSTTLPPLRIHFRPGGELVEGSLGEAWARYSGEKF